ncbi:OmpA family protein [bacterium]|nr:OmpA family protein [bacterium]
MNFKMFSDNVLLPSLLLPALALTATAEPVNMLSLQEGAFPVIEPAHYGSWYAYNMLDDSPQSGWACVSGAVGGNVFVFELVAPATLERFEFDNANVDAEGAGAKDILVEVSDTSATAGFTRVMEASLADLTDGQVYPATAPAPGRWVRLTIVNNQGNREWTELFGFRGFGEKPAMALPDNISGTYASDYSDFHVLQQGTALSGCYEWDEGLLDGVIDGRVMKITWRESGGPDDSGPAVMVFAPDGKSFRGYFWNVGYGNGSPNGTWGGKLTSRTVGGCPHWSGSVGGELKKQLVADKRARIFGILFDTGSAVIRTESRPVLDQVLGLLREESGWALTIEGHTDAVGPDEANLTLSRKRAESVKAYLVKAGIEEGRLEAAGYGESGPIADNDTELGRAQNRRVELVRE